MNLQDSRSNSAGPRDDSRLGLSCLQTLSPPSQRYQAALFDLVLPRIRAALNAYENAVITQPRNEAPAMASLRCLGDAIISLSLIDVKMRSSADVSGEA